MGSRAASTRFGTETYDEATTVMRTRAIAAVLCSATLFGASTPLARVLVGAIEQHMYAHDFALEGRRHTRMRTGTSR